MDQELHRGDPERRLRASITLPPERRLPIVRALIERQPYFVVHAPRQSGKTTALLALAEALTSEGAAAVVVVSVETGQPFGRDPGAAESAILSLSLPDACASLACRRSSSRC